MEKSNKKSNNPKFTAQQVFDAQNMLDIIRERQGDSTKLKKFLNDIDKDDSYKDTELYQLGFEDGQVAGKDLAEQRYAEELRALRTFLDAMIETK